MSYDFRIVPSSNLMFEWWEGPLDGSALWEAIQVSLGHPDHRPGLDVIADFTRAELSLSYEEMRDFVVRASGDRRLDTGKVAFIVSRPLERGMIRMFQMISEESSHWAGLSICESFEEARSWLGLPESTEAPVREERHG